MMTQQLDIPTLKQTIELCYTYSRDNERFTQEERDGWLTQADTLRAHLVELEAAEFKPELDSKVGSSGSGVRIV